MRATLFGTKSENLCLVLVMTKLIGTNPLHSRKNTYLRTINQQGLSKYFLLLMSCDIDV